MLIKLLKFISHYSFRIYFRIIRLLRIALEKFFLRIYSKNPLIYKPIADKNTFLNLHHLAKNVVYPEIDKYENEMGYFINKKWIDDIALHTQVVIKKSPICYSHGRVLYSALSKYINEIVSSNSFQLSL